MEPTQTPKESVLPYFFLMVIIFIVLSGLLSFTFYSGSWWGRLNNQCIVSPQAGQSGQLK